MEITKSKEQKEKKLKKYEQSLTNLLGNNKGMSTHIVKVPEVEEREGSRIVEKILPEILPNLMKNMNINM